MCREEVRNGRAVVPHAQWARAAGGAPSLRRGAPPLLWLDLTHGQRVDSRRWEEKRPSYFGGRIATLAPFEPTVMDKGNFSGEVPHDTGPRRAVARGYWNWRQRPTQPTVAAGACLRGPGHRCRASSSGLMLEIHT